MRIRDIIAIATAALAVGCAGTIRHESAITGQFDDGTPLAGSALASASYDASGFTSKKGTFWVAAPGGVRCSGDYDPLDTSRAIVAKVSCSDGRKGETVITRTADLRSGSAIVRLNDGTGGQFVYGDITYSQAFGRGGTATTNTIQNVRLVK